MISDDHEEAVASLQRQQRRKDLERDVEEAERGAAEAVRLWMAAVRKMIVSAPSIGDALLDARDRDIQK